jgi:hypothetical protein
VRLCIWHHEKGCQWKIDEIDIQSNNEDALPSVLRAYRLGKDIMKKYLKAGRFPTGKFVIL